MVDLLLGGSLLLLAGGIVFYLYRSKKRGRGCAGCPYAKGCGGCCEAGDKKKT